MKRAALALLVTLQPAPAAAAVAPPLGQILLGTLRDANSSVALADGYTSCGLSTRLTPGTAFVVDQGPVTSLWRRNISAGPITVTLPALGRAVVPYGGAATWTYLAAGTAQLFFTAPTTGSLVFLGPATVVNTAHVAPHFTNFSLVWDPTSRQLAMNFTLLVDDCVLSVSGVYGG